jgi:spermidine synthase
MKKKVSRSVPLKGKVYKSEINGRLELNWLDGRLLLDSANANYSYGALQRALGEGLLHIGRAEVANFKNILVLGMGAGSVIETLRKEFRNEGKITAVEIDPVVVDIAKKYFKVNDFANLEIVVEDALSFVLKNKIKFDFILVDLFIDSETPKVFSSVKFLNGLLKSLLVEGTILFNTVNVAEKFSARNQKMLRFFEKHCTVTVLTAIEEGNDLLLFKKLPKQRIL